MLSQVVVREAEVQKVILCDVTMKPLEKGPIAFADKHMDVHLSAEGLTLMPESVRGDRDLLCICVKLWFARSDLIKSGWFVAHAEPSAEKGWKNFDITEKDSLGLLADLHAGGTVYWEVGGGILRGRYTLKKTLIDRNGLAAVAVGRQGSDTK